MTQRQENMTLESWSEQLPCGCPFSSLIDILEVRFEIIDRSIQESLDVISESSILGLLHRKALKTKPLRISGR